MEQHISLSAVLISPFIASPRDSPMHTFTPLLLDLALRNPLDVCAPRLFPTASTPLCSALQLNEATMGLQRGHVQCSIK